MRKTEGSRCISSRIAARSASRMGIRAMVHSA
jgi:hypothetical protein